MRNHTQARGGDRVPGDQGRASAGVPAAREAGTARKPSARSTREARAGPGTQRRPPSDKPDVFLDIPDVHVGEIHLDVESLDAHLSLQARLATLVELVAGVHVHIDKVELDIKDVGAEVVLKVRLENLYQLLDRALTTVDRNPEILQGLLDTVGTTAGSLGETAQQAVRPGGAVSSLADNVGQVGRQALGPGGAATEAVGSVGGAAGEAVGDVGGAAGEAVGNVGGAAGKAVGDVGDAAAKAVQADGATTQAARSGPDGGQGAEDGRMGLSDPALRDGHRKAPPPKAAGTEMSGGMDRPRRVFELEFRAWARDICFRLPGDAQIETEGAAHLERVTQRDNLPVPVAPAVRYKNVRVSTRIVAWLDVPDL